MVNHTNYSETMNGDATLLLVEREKLLLRLKEINQALNRTYSLQASSAKTISTPLVSKQTTIPVKCKYDFSVYVYEIPKSLRSIQVSEEARTNKSLHICQKCILEQFALEYILFDFFTQFCGRTYDPEKADFFYLPIVRDAEYRFALQHFGPRSRTPSDAEEALLLILEKNDSSLWKNLFKISDKYWRARDGADHIIAMPAPVTNFRHQGSQRGFFHYMIQLSTPIFLSVEYSSEFIREYPFCSIRKNIVMPYPTTDPELFNGKLLKMPLKSSGQQFLRQNSKIENENKSIIINYKERRQYLLYYAGGLHGDCIEVRKAMKQLMNNCSRLANIIPPVRSNQEEREEGFLSSTFCPVPIGDSPSSKRMYDVLNFGCIPVVLSDELVWAFSDETNGPLNHSSFSVKLPQSVVQYNALRSLSHYASRKADFGVLPSGTLLYDLLLRAQKEGADFAAAAKGKSKVRIAGIFQYVSNVFITITTNCCKRVGKYFRIVVLIILLIL